MTGERSKNVVIIVLAVLLIAAVILGAIYHRKYMIMKATLRPPEELSELHEEIRRQIKSAYDTLVSDLNEQIQNREVTIKEFEERLSVTFVDRILFDFGKATITPEGERILAKVGEILKGIRGKRISVVGHTDDRPILPERQYKFPSNWELSGARAAAVVRYFQLKCGLDPRNMEAVGRSLYEPIASNETKEGRAQNRRVEIIIIPRFS